MEVEEGLPFSPIEVESRGGAAENESRRVIELQRLPEDGRLPLRLDGRVVMEDDPVGTASLEPFMVLVGVSGGCVDIEDVARSVRCDAGGMQVPMVEGEVVPESVAMEWLPLSSAMAPAWQAVPPLVPSPFMTPCTCESTDGSIFRFIACWYCWRGGDIGVFVAIPLGFDIDSTFISIAPAGTIREAGERVGRWV